MPVQPDAFALQLQELLGQHKARASHERKQARTRVRIVRTGATRVDPEVQLARDIESVVTKVVAEQLGKSPGLYRWRDEMVSDARVAATGAAVRWHADGGASRFTLMMIRARGALIDGIRDRSPLTRGEFDRGIEIDDLPQHRRDAVPLDVVMEDAGIEPVAPGDLAAAAADRDLIQRLLLRCTDRERTVLIATVVQGYSYTELAEHYGVTISRITQIRDTALAKLRDLATGSARLTLTVGGRGHHGGHATAHRRHP